MNVATLTPTGHLSIVRSVLEAERSHRLYGKRTAESVKAAQRIDDALKHLDEVRNALLSPTIE